MYSGWLPHHRRNQTCNPRWNGSLSGTYLPVLIAQELSSYYKLPLEEVLMPTFRPPVKPISMGALADAWEETVRDGDEGSYGSYDPSATKGGVCE